MGQKKYIYGLLGRNISYSFSKGYFTEKFTRMGLEDHIFTNFDISEITQLPDILKKYGNNLRGFNVTIPYKQVIFNYLDEIDRDAEKIGAVNVVKVFDHKKLKGFNTDSYGFKMSIEPLLKQNHKKALILGTGGASKAVSYILDKLGIHHLFVSRKYNSEIKFITYQDITGELLKEYPVIINATPVGTYPDVESAPDIPYRFLTSGNLLYDLIYNPSLTAFLKKGKDAGAIVKNGQEMLELQAEKAWEIWNS